MALARFQATVIDDEGNVIPNASIRVTREAGDALTSLFSDRAGATPLGNPFTADSEGYFAFHVAGGAYRVRAYSGATVYRDFRYVPVGTAAEKDASELAAGMNWEGDWVTATAFDENDAVAHDGASYICTADHTSGASTEPGVGASWATVWDLIAAKGNTGNTGATGATGPAGAVGATGPNTGYDFEFDTGTTDANPGAGKIRVNNATLGSATFAYISKTDRPGNSIGSIIGGWDDSNNTAHRGRLRVFDIADKTKGWIANVTAAFTDGTTYWKIPFADITVLSGGAPSASAILAVVWDQTGNKGADGAGTGDVVGPASATDNRLALFDGATGKLLKDSGGPGVTSGRITGVSTPSSGTDVATKDYVDGLAVNLGKRQRVRAATTGNVTISTAFNNGDTLDGVTLATGDLVLAKDQSSAADNGVYVVGVSPARAAEFDSYNEHPGALVAVAEGTANADTVWLCTSNDGGTLGSTSIVFSQFAPNASETVRGLVELATAAEINTGTDADRAISPDRLAGSNFGKAVLSVLVFDDSQDVVTGDGAGDVFVRIPSAMNGMNLVEVAACVQTAGTTGTNDIQVARIRSGSPVDMLSTKITIDSTEVDSATAATPAVINGSNDDVQTGDQIRIDVDAASTTKAKGLLVELTFQLP